MLVKIDRMAPEGQGLGRPVEGGRVVFVPYACPGDVLEVKIERAKTGFSMASLVRVEERGPQRIVPPCPYHFRPPSAPDHELPPSAREENGGAQRTTGPGPWCGGCDWQQLSPSAQLAAKRENVRDCLFRIARLREPKVEDTLPSPSPWRYRNKVMVPFGRKGSRVIAGFYAPGSHHIVDFEDCPVQPELSVRIVLRIKAFAQEAGWRVYDDATHSGWLRHVYVRTNRDGRALVTLVTRTYDFPEEKKFVPLLLEAFPEIVGLFQNAQPMKTPVVLGPDWRKVWGEDTIEEKLGPIRLRVSPAAFLQVNTPACEVLYGVARDFLTLGGFRPELALDLYCGVGSVALWIAPACERVLGVDENRDAVADAWENARLNGVRNARFLAGSVETQLGKLRKTLSSSEPGSAAAVLDPPRAGCSKPVLKSLLDPALGRVVYISCNPATFARDADWLNRHGWRLSRVQPVDLFPQTSHVETVGLFERQAHPEHQEP